MKNRKTHINLHNLESLESSKNGVHVRAANGRLELLNLFFPSHQTVAHHVSHCPVHTTHTESERIEDVLINVVWISLHVKNSSESLLLLLLVVIIKKISSKKGRSSSSSYVVVQSIQRDLCSFLPLPTLWIRSQNEQPRAFGTMKDYPTRSFDWDALIRTRLLKLLSGGQKEGRCEKDALFFINKVLLLLFLSEWNSMHCSENLGQKSRSSSKHRMSPVTSDIIDQHLSKKNRRQRPKPGRRLNDEDEVAKIHVACARFFLAQPSTHVL